MGYQLNGQDITTLCEIAWGSGDTRTKSDFNTSKYWFNGGTRASKYPNEQFISYPSGYNYAVDGLNGKFSGYPTTQKKVYQASAVGCRPVHKYRYSATSGGTTYINKFTDGEIWISSASNSRSGTRLCTASQNFKYLFMCLGGAGGGGGGGNALASGGGGGGAGYVYCLENMVSGYTRTFSIGTAGSGGVGGDNKGTNGTSTSFYRRSGSQVKDQVIANGGNGGSGASSKGGGGSGGSSGSFTCSGAYKVYARSGANGGSRNNSGGTATANFNNYTPEQEQIVYITGSGGSGGGSSGGGGGGGSPLGNGGKGGTKANGANGGTSAGGGGGGYKAFSSTTGGKGGSGYIALYY